MTDSHAVRLEPAPPSAVRPGSPKAWVLAARPATLTAALSPVAVGTACALHEGQLRLGPGLAAAAGAILLQIGANFANDVYDFEKGADTAERLGPTRAVQAGLIAPAAIRRGMALVFGLALLVGVYLTFAAGPTIVAIGLSSIAAAILYTGGPYPLGYYGLGDVFVFLFFGVIAVCGTSFVHTLDWPWLALWASLPMGALSTAILVVNNLRDRETDAKVGKRTLAVRWGRRGALAEYLALLGLAYATPVALVAAGRLGPLALLPLASAPLGVALYRRVAREQGRALNPLLGKTARLLLVFALLFALGIALDAPGHAG
jgi:1,4-dihydroxy-2-naphthoate polyprenyltransferase